MRRCLNCMEEYPENYEACPHCGFIDGVTANGGINLPPGTILQGRYIVGTIIKTRETDVFYIGWDALFDRKVQIQEYFPRYCAARSGRPELSVYDSKKEPFEAGLEMFCGQSRQLIRLYKEEDVVTYHACFIENGTAYAIQEQQTYETLSDKLGGQTVRVKDAEKWLYEAAAAVEKAHQIGVCHGQIGLDAFWVRPGGGLILKDFGASRYISGEPGIVDHGRVGSGTDVYGLAKMFCQMIVGQEIEEEDKLEAALLKKQVSLKKTMVAALRAALQHKTDSVERFCQGFRGERHIALGSRKKRGTGRSLRLPRWLLLSAAVLLIGVLTFTGLVAAGRVPLRFALGRSRVAAGMARVPNVTGNDADKMEKELAREGLEMSQVETQYSKEIPQNRISYQDPKEGSQVPAGSVVKVWISKGPEKAVIPPVAGRSRADALKLLKKAGFINVKVEESQVEGAYDTVVDISQEQGANVELDQEIVLTVCMNEDSGDPNIQVKVPDVQGKDRKEAEALLTGEDFRVNWVEDTSDQPEGLVLGQEPAAGTSSNKGSYVTVRVSKGAETIYMENVQLLSREEAAAVVVELGLTLGEVTEEYSDSVEAGKVISQGIGQDTQVKPGDIVTLVISKGKDPAKETEAPRQEQEPDKAAQDAEAARRREAEAAAAAQREAEAAEAAQRAAEEAARKAAEEAALQQDGATSDDKGKAEGDQQKDGGAASENGDGSQRSDGDSTSKDGDGGDQQGDQGAPAEDVQQVEPPPSEKGDAGGDIKAGPGGGVYTEANQVSPVTDGNADPNQ